MKSRELSAAPKVVHSTPKASALEILPTVYDSEHLKGEVIGGIPWRPEFSDLRISLINSSDSDLIDIDLVIEPDQPIVKVGQIGFNSGVSFLGDVTSEVVDVGGMSARMPTIDKVVNGRRLSLPAIQLNCPRYRVRCQTIPKKSSIELVMAIAEVKSATVLLTIRPGPGQSELPPTIVGLRSDGLSKPHFEKKIPSRISVEGTYNSSSVTVHVSQAVPVRT